MATDPAEASSIQATHTAPTTHFDSTDSPDLLDGTAEEVASKSPLQHAVEIIAPILAFLAVAIITAPIAEACREEIPGTIPAVALILLRVLLAFMAARFAARWVSR